MKATRAAMNRFADIKIPTVKLSTEFAASMQATQAIMDRFADIRVPTLKQYDKISTTLTRTHEHLAPITISNSRPALLHHRGLDFMPTISVDRPVVSQVSPAEDVLRRVSEQRHDVVVGYASFQYEILTIEIPPQSPTLRII